MHFAKESAFVDGHIESTTADVVTPAELVTEINHGEDMTGCIGELF